MSAALLTGYAVLIMAAGLGRLWWPGAAWLVLAGLATAAAVAVAPVRFPPRDPLAWLSLAVATVVFSLADAILAARPTPPVRLVDALYAAAYALVVATLYRLNRQAAQSTGFYDAAAMAAGLAVALAAVLAERPWRTHADNLTLLYPLAGVAILVLSVRLMRAVRTPSSWLMLAAAVCLLASGSLPVLLNYPQAATPPQTLRIAMLACWGLAALLPPPDNLRAVDSLDRRPPVWLFAVVVLLAPAALLVRAEADDDIREVVLTMACAFAGLFAVVRLGGLARANTTDPVTGLMVVPVLLIEARAQLAAGKTPTLFLVDLGQFHVVHEPTGGHQGDRALRHIARQLSRAAGDARVARGSLGRFAVLAELPPDDSAAGRLAAELTAALAGPVTVNGKRLNLTCCLGYAIADTCADVDELLVNAEVALHAAKSAGPGSSIGYHQGLREAELEMAMLTADLRVAIDAGQLLLEYQPIVALDGGLIEGFEALIRWQHPRLGRLGPDRFVHLSESAGLIGELGAWVLSQGVAGAAALNAAATRPIFVDINVSAAQFGPRLARELRQALADYAVDPSLIVLELTESMLIPNLNWLAGELQGLKATGIRVAVDDFGTGHSSLARLKDLPIDVIKIDRMFIAGLTPGGPAQLITGILQIAAALDVDVVAEGIERATERDLLAKLGCRLGQGYFYGRPVPLDQAKALVQAGPAVS